MEVRYRPQLPLPEQHRGWTLIVSGGFWPARGPFSDEVTVPKYIRAGTKKIAWLWPGTTGEDNTATEYQNRYFDTEREALALVLA